MIFSDALEQTTALFLSFGAVGLFVLAFIESSFFPIPPDVVLIPLTLANPDQWLLYATMATVGSVAGAVFGYWLGWKGGRPALERYVSDQNIDRVQNYYDEYGVLAVGIAGFSPIPYKVFAISSGTFKLDMKSFIAVSTVSRGARFFAEAALLYLYGEQIVTMLQGPFGIITLVLAAAFMVAYVLWKQYL